MADLRGRLPEGRYGRRSAGDDARADRTLKIVGGVLGAAFLAMIGWFGISYISASSDISAELIKFKVVSDNEVQAHLEVRKGAEVRGVCALRALSADKAEVGRKDFAFEQRESRVDRVVTLRTTGRATTAELVGCEPTGGR
ncbi:DUF4307 domain-containing protein [Streptomyces gobiensis]|uniref:DUF4307 domain-containing protein n=1 Tax=Streptomyces gobiensis TaxID=2875706 RepID=UPI001E520983|nr:DUF4307 domain-containing protein [Streptomyces gobiensis]UGY93349.1 DUF4307 domain-containing protein [Streptomyces gobiensis]